MLASNHLIGFGAAEAAGVWTSIASNALGASDQAGWSNVTKVQFIPQSSLAATGGTQVRLTLKCPASVGSAITAMYIGQASASYSATSPAFASTPVQILVGGSGTITLSAGGSDVLTDVASFVMPSANGLCVSWQVTSSSNFSNSGNASPTGWKISYKSTASDANTVAKSGYTDYTAQTLGEVVKLVEELI